MTTHKCHCGTEFEYDDWDFSSDIICPNLNCKQEYDLECDMIELEDGSWEHDHYLEKR